MVTIHIREDSIQAKQFIEFVKTLPFASVNSEKKSIKLTQKETKYLSELKLAVKQVKDRSGKKLEDLLNEV
jgi:hypothetical protein